MNDNCDEHRLTFVIFGAIIALEWVKLTVVFILFKKFTVAVKK